MGSIGTLCRIVLFSLLHGWIPSSSCQSWNVIRNGVYQDSCVDITGNVNGNGVTVELYPCVVGAPNELFLFNYAPVSGQYYFLIYSSFLCFDSTDGSTVTQNNCTQSKPSQTFNELSLTRTDRAGYFMIQNQLYFLCMTVPVGGGPATLITCDETDDTQLYTWAAPQTPNLLNYNGQCVEISNSAMTDGAIVDSSPCITNASNQFIFGINLYGLNFQANSSGQCLDGTASGAYGGDPTRVVQWDCAAGFPGQYWIPHLYLGEPWSWWQYYRNALNNLCLASDPNDSNRLYETACAQGDAAQQFERCSNAYKTPGCPY